MNGDNETNWMLIGAVISTIVLVLFALYNYVPEDSVKSFSLDGFYVGNKDNEVDPKSLYNKVYEDKSSEYNCNLTIEKADDRYLVNNITWVVGGVKITDIVQLENIIVDNSDSSIIKPYDTAHTEIISPAKIEFLNSNVVTTEKDSITIKAAIGDDYVIEWVGMTAWYCHIGSEDPTKHSTVCGANGANPVCKEGYIIGQANAETLVKLYKVDANGNSVPASFLEFYQFK